MFSNRESETTKYCLKFLIIGVVFFAVTFYLCVDIEQIGEKNDPVQMAARRLMSVDFEVFGQVQGVFFRKYTRTAAQDNDLVGWCMNTHDGTVKGQIQGEPANIAKMKHWLETVGSPHSRIERAVFKNEKEIDKLEHKGFSVEH